MKTAISIPDELFDAADHTARALGMSRSELYARAVAQFLELRSDQTITKKLNEVYGKVVSDLDPALEAMEFGTLSDEEW